jgi:hypothetical protein
VGATRLLQHGTDADYLEMEALPDDHRARIRAIKRMYADFAAGMVRAPSRVTR